MATLGASFDLEKLLELQNAPLATQITLGAH